MIKKSISILVLTSTIYAQNIELNKIISHVRESHPNYQAMDEENIALNAKIQAEYARPASSLSLSGANASSDDRDEFEYSVGASTLVDIANTRGLELSSADLKNQAEILTKQKRLFKFGNNIRNFYHQSCLDKEELTVLQTTLDAFNRLYIKKQKAYKYQEISKKELLQLELEKRMLEQKLASAKRQYGISKESLLNLTAIEYKNDTELECRDLYPIMGTIELENEPFILTHLAYEKEIESIDKLHTRYNKAFEPIEVGLAYDDEMDTQRVGAGFSIPLSFTSSKNEKSRIYLLHKKNMIKYKHHGWLLETMAEKKRLESQLKNDYNKITALTANINIYKDELMPLIEKSFQMGESSVIEYIMGRQKLLGISAELILAKKNYYERLFTLYTIVETEK
jgi:outer membrane protein TolC